MALQELNAIMGLLYRLLDVRITFFDMQERELATFDIKAMSPYCAARRRRRTFNEQCMACDRTHLQEATRTRDVLIYHCHEGLIEGIVPLYDKRGVYLGAIVFGQLRDPRRPAPTGSDGDQRRLYRQLRSCTPTRARDIGYLLKYVSEYIIEKELIRYRNRPWAEKIERYIAANSDRRIPLRELATLIGQSPSFVSHHFKTEFGHSAHDYVMRVKMAKARQLIENGASVKEASNALGFCDPFHLSKRFKAHWGAPPSHFSRPDRTRSSGP